MCDQSGTTTPGIRMPMLRAVAATGHPVKTISAHTRFQ